ncbi:pentatricopeptide repeat-containing protein At2g34400 [Selaginella moellendorffii]|uniref:pentatricopeptide repeat-containing protein At2g34400 n=1 Tax=Selaginella moellendorffii TaxID=88036 RepID=UPI000D1C429A|nr:pentatricopeptide repeat-containing protein At2g34400 [Selaginella moellendorffii]|eukprot:XP_024537590.1 pentatricopeptide repeat-containing protein At2g34400 [Selaginella moellendorffii]
MRQLRDRQERLPANAGPRDPLLEPDHRRPRPAPRIGGGDRDIPEIAAPGRHSGQDHVRRGPWSVLWIAISSSGLRGAIRVFQGMKKRDVVAWTAIIAAFAQYGHLEKAFLTYRGMLLEGFLPVLVTFLALLNALAEERDWDRGRWIHRHITEMKLESELSMAAALITMFGKCGDLKKARRVFRRIHQPDLEVYNALLAAHTENGEFWNALLLFRRMQEDGVAPDRETVLVALGACIRPVDLEHGKGIHVSVINHDLEKDIDVANALIYMYSKCGSLEDAEWMFQRVERPSMVSWRTLLAAYVKHGRNEEALISFRKMLLEGISPGRGACVSALRACGSLRLPGQGRLIHLIVRELGLESHNRVVCTVVEMYGKCKCLEDARSVFEKIEQPNPSSWNSIVAAYLDCGCMEEAFGQFRRMQLEGVKLNRRSPALVVKAIAACSSLRELEEIHGYTVEMGADSSSVVGNALLAAYCRLSGELEDAERVLEKMDHNRDKEAWTSVFALCGGKNDVTDSNRIGRISNDVCSIRKVGRLFRRMLLDGVKPDKTTFTLVLSACMEAQEAPVSADQVAFIHSFIIECELETDATIAVFLLSAYGRCKALQEAYAVFSKNHHLGVAVWNAMISAFAENGVPKNGFLLFQRMAREGVMPNRSTFAGVLNAIGSVGASGLEQGKIVHSEAVQLGIELDPIVATALVNMYHGCNCVDADVVAIKKWTVDRNDS